MSYAAEITKEELIKRFGIQFVKEDGSVVIGPSGKILTQQNRKSGERFLYKAVGVYDKENPEKLPRKQKRKLKNGEIKTYDNYTYKQTTLGVHRLVWIWYNGIQHEGMVIDHINNNQFDNRLENLQEITVEENLKKDKDENFTRLEKACPIKGKQYYIDLLEEYIKEYEKAKENKEADLCHKLRGCISLQKAKLRDWEENEEEYNLIYTEYIQNKEAKKAHSEQVKERAATIDLLEENIVKAREEWHENPCVATRDNWKAAINELKIYKTQNPKQKID